MRLELDVEYLVWLIDLTGLQMFQLTQFQLIRGVVPDVFLQRQLLRSAICQFDFEKQDQDSLVWQRYG